MFLGNKRDASFKSMIKSVGDTFLINGAAEIAQFGVFIILGIIILPLFFKDINCAFGLMLPAGFVGGHGTAAAIGSVLSEWGWDDAKSVGQTFATVGLLGGIIIGVLLINIGTRLGYTKVIKRIEDLPKEMLTGFVPVDRRSVLGENTVNSMAIDPLTWHVSLVMISVGGAYLVNTFLRSVLPQISFPVYGIALILSIGIQPILNLLKIGDYVDKRIIGHLGSTATDFLVAFGVASINISVVIKYIVPIVVLSILGFIYSYAWFWCISRNFFRNYWFERGIYIFGMLTGVLATGVILLRITDPEFKTGALEDFGFAWIFLSIVDLLLVSFSPIFVMEGTGIWYAAFLISVSVLSLLICKKQFIIKE